MPVPKHKIGRSALNHLSRKWISNDRTVALLNQQSFALLLTHSLKWFDNLKSSKRWLNSRCASYSSGSDPISTCDVQTDVSNKNPHFRELCIQGPLKISSYYLLKMTELHFSDIMLSCDCVFSCDISYQKLQSSLEGKIRLPVNHI